VLRLGAEPGPGVLPREAGERGAVRGDGGGGGGGVDGDGEKKEKRVRKFSYSPAKKVGVFGIVHPDAAAAFGLEGRAVVGALELDLEPFCFDQSYRKLRTHLDMNLF
jgi:hypothetical protein